MNHHETDLREILDFSEALHSRNYNAGYREGLFKGKQEVIQQGFDAGFELGARYVISSRLVKAFCESENLNLDVKVDENEIKAKVEELKLVLDRNFTVLPKFL